MLSWTYLSVDIKKSTRVQEQSSRTIALIQDIFLQYRVLFLSCVFL